MSLREITEREFRFHLASDPLAQAIALWREGDQPITVTPSEELRAMKAYAVATNKALFFLADALDRLEIGPGEPEE